MSAACSTQQAQSPPPKPAPPPLEFLGEWGTRGDAPGQLQKPLSFAVDSFGNVYVADLGATSTSIHKFTRDGHPLQSFTPRINSQHPCSLAVDRGGAIYLAECHRSELYVFLPDGLLFRSMHRGASRELGRPEGVTVDAEGNMYVVESTANRISKFNSAGRFVKTWGMPGSGPGELANPAKIALGPDGLLYVADVMNHRVQKFSLDGVYIAAWPAPFSDQPPTFQGYAINGLAVSTNYVVASVCGSENGGKPLVQFWTLDGQPRFTENFLHRAEIIQSPIPVDVAIAPNGELLILDGANARVLRFRVNF